MCIQYDPLKKTKGIKEALAVVGKPVLRMTAFQVPEGVLTMVGIDFDQRAAPQRCTEIVPNPDFRRNERLRNRPQTRMNPW